MHPAVVWALASLANSAFDKGNQFRLFSSEALREGLLPLLMWLFISSPHIEANCITLE